MPPRTKPAVRSAPVRFAKLVVEHVESGSLLARSDEGSRAFRLAARAALSRFVLEPFIQQIGHAHGQDAQKLVHFFFAEAVKFPADFTSSAGLNLPGLALIGKRYASRGFGEMQRDF